MIFTLFPNHHSHRKLIIVLLSNKEREALASQLKIQEEEKQKTQAQNNLTNSVKTAKLEEQLQDPIPSTISEEFKKWSLSNLNELNLLESQIKYLTKQEQVLKMDFAKSIVRKLIRKEALVRQRDGIEKNIKVKKIKRNVLEAQIKAYGNENPKPFLFEMQKRLSTLEKYKMNHVFNNIDTPFNCALEKELNQLRLEEKYHNLNFLEEAMERVDPTGITQDEPSDWSYALTIRFDELEKLRNNFFEDSLKFKNSWSNILELEWQEISKKNIIFLNSIQ